MTVKISPLLTIVGRWRIGNYGRPKTAVAVNHLMLLAAFLGLIPPASVAQERLCPDGKRSYFGVCPQDQDGSRPLPAPQPRAELKFSIMSGVGLNECYIGMDARAFQRAFGGKAAGTYLRAPDKGIDASIQNGKITALFFYFYSRTHNSFPGSTDRGIESTSSIADVLAKYGQPDRLGESVVSEYGPMPGAFEKSLEYRRLGITFTFYDERLADIRTYPSW